ncbi:MAG: dTDP-4-dehydrorhamnose reductase [Alphaproteobacteria bacterium]|nr:dTDP-4-dehydrorhamnose reductase [Alphaproteobacteria bacterium]
MTILLIGRNGQVGRAIETRLASDDRLIAIDRNDLDFAKPADIPIVLDRLSPSLIINAAAFTDVDGAESQADAAFAINAAAPEALAKWAALHDAALLHFSTDYVYDGSGEQPWREGDLTGPLNVYGVSKLAGDRAISESGAAHLILRTSWVYAAEGQNFLKTMLRVGRDRETLMVVDDQIGAPTSADALADIVAQILTQAGDDPDGLFQQKGGVVQTVCGGAASWREFAEAIFAGARLRGADLMVTDVRPIPTSAYPTPARRPLNSRMSLERLNAQFGVTPPSWQDVLATVLDQLYAPAPVIDS